MVVFDFLEANTAEVRLSKNVRTVLWLIYHKSVSLRRLLYSLQEEMLYTKEWSEFGTRFAFLHKILMT